MRYYVKIWLTVPRSRPVLLRFTGSGARFALGIAVNHDGDEITKPGVDEQLHVIERSMILMWKEYRFNNTYAKLQPHGKIHNGADSLGKGFDI